MSFRCWFAIGLVVPFLPAFAGKKYIAFGWEFETATPSNILQIVDSLDRTPLDGVGLFPRLTDRSGKPIKSKLMDQPALEWADLEPWTPVLRELSAHKSMRESVIKSICAPTNRLDWTDDAAWRRVSATMRNLARLAREGGLKGLWVDDEDYHRQRQYYWRAGDPPYDRLCEIARARGREVFSAAFEEYPDMTLFFFRFFTRVHAYAACENPSSACRARGDLWPFFLNGLLDILPPKARLVDGYEYGYRFDAQRGDYHYGYANQKSRFARLASPVNRTKYLTQVSSAPAVYMDMYVNPEGQRWHAPPLNGSRAARFVANVEQAAYVADDYVWFWGEKRCWATWGTLRRKSLSSETWETSLPGVSDPLAFFKSPHDFAVRRLAELKRTGAFRPLNDNVECRCPQPEGDGLEAPYSSWSDPDVGQPGSFAFDSSVGEGDGSSLVAKGVSKGCFVLSSGPVRTGEIYLVGFSSRGDMVGGGVEWKLNGKWNFKVPGVSVWQSKPDATGWRHALTAIRIPEDADGFGLQLSVCQGPDECCWFDNVFYCRAE